jgi:hypothetical protein
MFCFILNEVNNKIGYLKEEIKGRYDFPFGQAFLPVDCNVLKMRKAWLPRNFPF